MEVNVLFITKDDRVKILDFGLANLRGDSGEPRAADLKK